MRKLKLGEWYDVKATSEKHRYQSETSRVRRELSKTVKMMFIGNRTVYEGYARGDWDEREFIQTKSIPVYLFVENGNKNPVYVLPEDALVGNDQ